MVVRTRFAPSPTGFLHVGGVRTALFSWLYAKHHNGQFILRIEDTDKTRSTDESVQVILDGMKWLGLDYDDDVYYQSKRFPRYRELLDKLLEEGKAYRCECSIERLEKLREHQLENKQKPRYDGYCRDKNLPESNEPYVIRFKNPLQGEVCFTDEVYGDITVKNEELDDLIIQRTDKYPTYNFAVVVDDWDMGITHVIRGDDHINNTPRQINIFKALGADVPVFSHLPMILGDDGKRLSKRHGAVSVLQFKEEGILPHALLNYLVRLGWSHGDQEIFDLGEMIEKFDLNHVSRAASSFNYEKLYWLNQHYQKFEKPAYVAKALLEHFKTRQIDVSNGPVLESIVSIQAERCKNLEEMCEKSLYFYLDDIDYDPAAIKKHLRPVVYEPLLTLSEQFSQIQEWTADTLQSAINDVCATYDLGMGKIAQPLRVAVTGTSMSPSIDMTLTLLGKSRVMSRLDHGLELIRQRMEQS